MDSLADRLRQYLAHRTTSEIPSDLLKEAIDYIAREPDMLWDGGDPEQDYQHVTDITSEYGEDDIVEIWRAWRAPTIWAWIPRAAEGADESPEVVFFPTKEAAVAARTMSAS